MTFIQYFKIKKGDLVALRAEEALAASPLRALEAWYQVIVVCLVPLNGEEEVPIQAEGVLGGAWEVGKSQMGTFQDPMVVAVEETTLLFLEALEALGVVLRARVDID